MSVTTLVKPAPTLPPEIVHEIISLAAPVDWSANSVKRYKALCRYSLVNSTWGAQAQALLFQEIHVRHERQISPLLRVLTDGCRRTLKLVVGDFDFEWGSEDCFEFIPSKKIASILAKLPSVQEVILGSDVEQVHLSDVCQAGVTTLRFLRYATFRSPQDHTFANITSLHLPVIDEETLLFFPALLALYTERNLVDWVSQNTSVLKLEAFGFEAGKSWPLTSPLKSLQIPVLEGFIPLPTSLEVLRVLSGGTMGFDKVENFFQNLAAHLSSTPALRVLHLPLKYCADDATLEGKVPPQFPFSFALWVLRPFTLGKDFEETCTAAGVSIVYSQDSQGGYESSNAALLKMNFWDEVKALLNRK